LLNKAFSFILVLCHNINYGVWSISMINEKLSFSGWWETKASPSSQVTWKFKMWHELLMKSYISTQGENVWESRARQPHICKIKPPIGSWDSLESQMFKMSIGGSKHLWMAHFINQWKGLATSYNVVKENLLVRSCGYLKNVTTY